MFKYCSWIAGLLSVALLCPLPAAAASPAGQAGMRIEIVGVEIGKSPAAWIESGSALVPAGPLFRALGFAVWQDAEGRSAVGEKAELHIQFKEGEKEARWRSGAHGGVLLLPVAPVSLGRTLYVPIRALAEFDGRETAWHEASRRIAVSERAASPQPPAFADVIIEFMSESDMPLSGDDPWVQAAEQAAGVSVSWVSVPSPHYRDKTNVMIAAGDMPDILYLKQPSGYNPDLPAAFLRDVSSELNAYPYLSAAVETHERAAYAPDGFLLGIPRQTPVEQLRFPFIRQDWLDKLGLATPSNADELMQVMDLFTNYDPDGNGKLDTWGLGGASAIGADLGRLTWIERLFTGSVGRFAENGDGGYTDTLLETGTRDALQWLNEAYKRGYLSPEFPVLTEEHYLASIAGERVGIAELTLREANELNRGFQSGRSGARLVPLAGLKTAEGGPLLPGNARYAGALTIPQSVSDEKLPAVLSLLEALHTPPVGAGLPEPGEAISAYMGWDGAPGEWFDDAAGIDPEPFAALVEQWRAAAPTWDPTMPGWPDHETKEAIVRWNDRIAEMKTKFVLGAVTFSEWDALVKEIRSDAAYREVLGE